MPVLDFFTSGSAAAVLAVGFAAGFVASDEGAALAGAAAVDAAFAGPARAHPTQSGSQELQKAANAEMKIRSCLAPEKRGFSV
jgi:hypothetical protein